MKFTFTISAIPFALLALTSCQGSDEDIQTSDSKFPITQPIILDTAYTVDYVADINSIKNVEIRARVNGYIEQIHVDEGKMVKAGQLLFNISSMEYKEELLKAKAMLKNAIAEAKAAELDYQNTILLHEKNVVSKTEVDIAKSKLEALNAKIEEAQSHEAGAKLRLSFTEIRAPFDGIIDRIPNKIGSLIAEGDLLTTISDNHQVFTYFHVSEIEYLEFAKNSKDTSSGKSVLSLLLANHEMYPYKGDIETIEGQIDPNTGSIAFRARFANPDKLLRHGSSGKVRLKRYLKKALIIPQKSTFEIQDRVFVYVVNDSNVVKMKSFVPKLRLPHLYIVESGLTVNDKIIFEGIQDIKVDSKVNTEMIPMTKILNDFSTK
jgi:membrane fusion protein (multidrug efflux system)